MYKNLKDNVPNEKHQIDPKTIGGSLKIINPNLTHNRHNHIISGKCNRRAQEYVLYPQKYSNTLLIKTNSRAAKDIKYQNTDRRKNCQAILKNHKNSHMKSNTHLCYEEKQTEVTWKNRSLLLHENHFKKSNRNVCLTVKLRFF